MNDQIPVTIEHPIDLPNAQAAQTAGLPALAMDPKELTKALRRYKSNRRKLLRWLGDNLIEGIDYGRIHIVGKPKPDEGYRGCPDGDRCANPFHYSKKILFKPGAEKILGYLNARPSWPNLSDWERQAMEGRKIADVVLSCQILNIADQEMGQGIGARTAKQDGWDLNKRLKMAKKTSMIDAVISTAGISEMFTLDIDDQPGKQEDMIDEYDRCPIGPWTGKPLAKLSRDQLKWVLDNAEDAELRERVRDLMRGSGRPTSGGRQAGKTASGPPKPTEAVDGEELTLGQANAKIVEALSTEELQRVWESLPERFATPLTRIYEDRRKELGS